MALATGKRAGTARQGEIFQPDIEQKRQPVADFLQHPAGDLVALGVELRRQGAKPVFGRLHRQFRHLADVETVDFDRQRFRFQPKTVAGGAGRGSHETRDFLARPFAFGFKPPPLKVAHHALERLVDLIGAQAVIIGHAHILLAGAVEDDIAGFFGQVPEGHIEAKIEMLRQCLQRLQVIGRG